MRPAMAFELKQDEEVGHAIRRIVGERISDALDQQRIVNVAVTEQATVPAVPASPNWPLNLSLGCLMGCLFSIGLALTADYLDHSFRTPGEVETFLNVPVLAAFPQTALLASSSLRGRKSL